MTLESTLEFSIYNWREVAISKAQERYSDLSIYQETESDFLPLTSS